MLNPSDLGFGAEFGEFRIDPRNHQPVQWEAIEHAVLSDKRFVGLGVPTGVGKSLVAASIHKLTSSRTVILTATKALQSQYLRDFQKYGLIDIQGRSNYRCGDWSNLDCRSGASMGCRLCGGRGCEYEVKRDRARENPFVSTNYAYWLTANDKGDGIQMVGAQAAIEGANPVQILILDEAHSADAWLSDYLSVTVYKREIEKWADPKRLGEEMSVWQAISAQAAPWLEERIADEKLEVLKKGRRVVKKHLEELHRLENSLEKMKRISGMKGEWVVEKFEGTRWGRLWKFDLVWPGAYAERYLFCGVPKIVMMSATLRPKTMYRLGVKAEECDFREWDRVFPANRHPIYSIPARNGDREIRIDRRTSDEDLETWVEHIDQIIGGRLDRKGIIQTVSYARESYLMEHSRYASLMVGNTADPESDTALEVARGFREIAAPVILVSPSFAMGWDFPKSECEYIIICKVPFLNNGTKIQREREANDPTYSAYMAMQQLVQSAGRGMRSEDDRCEAIIVDGHLSWFLYRNKSLAPAWFVNAVRKVWEIPNPPEKLR